MQYFIFQSVILLTIAFFAGAALGCFLRELKQPNKPKQAAPASKAAQSDIDEIEEVTGPVISAAHGYVDMTRNIIEYPWAKEGAAVLASTKAAESALTTALESTPEPEPAPEPLPVEELVEDDDKPAEILRDNIRLINGINAQMEARLNKLGVYRYEQIANWTPADVERISTDLNFSGRIESECWVEQAKILASGGTMEMAEAVLYDTPVESEPEPLPPPVEENPASTVVDTPDNDEQDEEIIQTSSSARLQPIQEKQMPGKRRRIYSGAQNTAIQQWEDEDIFLQELSCPPKPVIKKEPLRRSPNQQTERDDLKKIKEIGAVHEKKLNAMGINRYEQIAEMSPAELKEVGKKINISSTDNAEEMVRQAKSLSEKV